MAGSTALTDVISGQVSFTIVDTILSITQISGGKVRALAVTSPKRKPTLPEVPTVSKSTNLPDFKYMDIFAVFGPPGLPMSIVRKLKASVQKSGEDAGLPARFGAIGLELQNGPSKQLRERFQHEPQRWTWAAVDAGIEPE
jgi:tripartite-type tricarboxylate transporter receptor subunit TctC